MPDHFWVTSTFRHALSGHGEPLLDAAKAALLAEIDRTFAAPA